MPPPEFAAQGWELPRWLSLESCLPRRAAGLWNDPAGDVRNREAPDDMKASVSGAFSIRALKLPYFDIFCRVNAEPSP